MNYSIQNINFFENEIKIIIQDDLSNEFNDEKLNIILNEIYSLKNSIIILLNDIHEEHQYMSRQKTIKNNNKKSNILNLYILYQNKIIEYYTWLNNLKTNCIKNYDYLVEWYDNTKKELNKVTSEYNKLKSEYDKYREEYLMNKNKRNSHSIEQSIKVEVLNSELSDVRTQMKFLKGINIKNKETIINLQKQLNEKINEYDLLNIENINNNKIANSEYQLDKVLHDRKYIIENNLALCDSYDNLKTNLEKTLNQLDCFEKKKYSKIQNEKENLEKLVNKLHIDINEQNNSKDKLINKILLQASELLPSYIWDDKYGFISKEYEVINKEKI